MINIKSKLENVNISKLKYVITFLVFIKPGIVDDFIFLDTLFNMARFGLTILFLCFFILSKKKLSVIKYPFFIFIIVLISTIVNDGIISKVLSHWFPVIGIITWAELNKNKIDRWVNVFYNIGWFLILVNFLLVIMYPNGLLVREYTPIWLLGGKQDFVSCMLPTVLFGGISLSLNKCNKSKYFSLLIMIGFTIFLTKPIGLAISFFIIGCMFLIDKLNMSMINMKILFCINILGEIVAILISNIYFNLTELHTFLDSIASSGLSKSQTVMFRVQMWRFALQTLKENPIFGVGQISEIDWYSKSGLPFYHSIIHNLPLDIAMTGGLTALVIFIYWNWKTVKQINKLWDVQVYRFNGIVLFAFNMLCIMECPYQPFLFLIFMFIPWDRHILHNEGKTIRKYRRYI